MGLDVSYYTKLKKLDAVFDASGELIDAATRESVPNYFRVYENPDFPGRAEGLEDRAIYSYEEEGMVGVRDMAASTVGAKPWRSSLAIR